MCVQLAGRIEGSRINHLKKAIQNFKGSLCFIPHLKKKKGGRCQGLWQSGVTQQSLAYKLLSEADRAPAGQCL